MIDTLTLSRELTKAGLPSAHADAIATGKIQQAADHGDHVTASDLRAEIVTVNGTIAALEVRLVKWMIGIVLLLLGLVDRLCALHGPLRGPDIQGPHDPRVDRD